MIVNLKALEKDDYIRCVLSKIEFSKIIFIYEIQLG